MNVANNKTIQKCFGPNENPNTSISLLLFVKKENILLRLLPLKKLWLVSLLLKSVSSLLPLLPEINRLVDSEDGDEELFIIY